MTLPADLKSPVNRLLTEVAQRTDGALDCWTVVCLAPEIAEPRSFLAQNSEKVRSLLGAIQSHFAGANDEQLDRLIQGLLDGCDEWESVFGTLGDFHNYSTDEIEAAVNALARLYGQRRDAIVELGRAIEAPIAYLEGQTQERRDYYRRILSSLADTFLRALRPASA